MTLTGRLLDRAPSVTPDVFRARGIGERFSFPRKDFDDARRAVLAVGWLKRALRGMPHTTPSWLVTTERTSRRELDSWIATRVPEPSIGALTRVLELRPPRPETLKGLHNRAALGSGASRRSRRIPAGLRTLDLRLTTRSANESKRDRSIAAAVTAIPGKLRFAATAAATTSVRRACRRRA